MTWGVALIYDCVSLNIYYQRLSENNKTESNRDRKGEGIQRLKEEKDQESQFAPAESLSLLKDEILEAGVIG